MIIKKFSSLITKMSNNKEILLESFYKSIKSVQPQYLIRKQISINIVDNQRHLVVCGYTYRLQKPCYLVGFGKAVAGMALELENILGANFKYGIVTIPQNFLENHPQINHCSKIKFIEGGVNNLPDQQSLNGSIEIKNLVEKLNSDDLLFVLISGGGSALLTLPKPPVTLNEKQDLIKQLQKNGININDLNKIRKFLSLLKGGGLAELTYPACTISLILSDIVGDPLDLIASGPTVPNRHNNLDEIKEILKKYTNFDQLSNAIKFVLDNYENIDINRRQFELFDNDGNYKHVKNFIIGNNRIAAEAAKTYLISKGYRSVILSTTITGNVTKIAQIYAEIAHNLCCNNKTNLVTFLKSLQKIDDADNDLNFKISDDIINEITNFDLNQPLCLISGGETTVLINGNGKGGRNQQLSLEFSIELRKKFENTGNNRFDIQFLSGGTDGIDGPTDAAGAITSLDFIHNYYNEIKNHNLIVEHYINNNDTYNFFMKYRNGENLIRIGHTGTNVMDIHILMITPK